MTIIIIPPELHGSSITFTYNVTMMHRMLEFRDLWNKIAKKMLHTFEKQVILESQTNASYSNKKSPGNKLKLEWFSIIFILFVGLFKRKVTLSFPKHFRFWKSVSKIAVIQNRINEHHLNSVNCRQFLFRSNARLHMKQRITFGVFLYVLEVVLIRLKRETKCKKLRHTEPNILIMDLKGRKVFRWVRQWWWVKMLTNIKSLYKHHSLNCEKLIEKMQSKTRNMYFTLVNWILRDRGSWKWLL